MTTLSYALGFVFTPDLDQILLIQKNRPDWLAGHHNGLGGKVEAGETTRQAMSRELWEESGLTIPPKAWDRFARMHWPGGYSDMFSGIWSGPPETAHTTTDEVVGWYSLAKLPTSVYPNLHWYIPLALDKLKRQTIKLVTIRYK